MYMDSSVDAFVFGLVERNSCHEMDFLGGIGSASHPNGRLDAAFALPFIPEIPTLPEVLAMMHVTMIRTVGHGVKTSHNSHIAPTKA
jgi:hypothetical protein